MVEVEAMLMDLEEEVVQGDKEDYFYFLENNGL